MAGRIKHLLSLFLVLTFLGAVSEPASAGQISKELRQAMDAAPPASRIPVILKILEPSPLKKSLLKGKPKAARNRIVVQELRKSAGLSQKSLLKALKEQQGKAEKIAPLWIVNAIALEATPGFIEELSSAYPQVEIVPDQVITLGATTLAAPGPAEWNLDKIQAPELWSLGYRGTGVVVATLDTGVDLYHPDLEAKYRGGTNSWYDPYGENATPADINFVGSTTNRSGHGTSVMGILVGGDASGTAIGVAPDARWIAAKIFPNSGNADTSKVLLALQWVLDPDGNASTDDSPDVVNNSWGDDPAVTSCGSTAQDTLLEDAVTAIRTAGILPVFASGNSGYAVLPAAYPDAVAVGSTDSNDLIESGSGQGPTACRSPSTYPNWVAPGVSVRTADLSYGGVLPDPYVTVSGTSYAAPHVAGAAALLLSAYPGLSLDDLEAALSSTAVPLDASTVPNDVYGYGRIDVKAAYDYLALPPLQLNSRPPPPSDVRVQRRASGSLRVSWTSSPGSGAGLTYSLSRNGVLIQSNLTNPLYDDTVTDDTASYTYSVVAAASGLTSEAARGLLGNIKLGNTITENRVDAFDLAVLMAAWGTTPSSSGWVEAADLNGDGLVNTLDQDILSAHFGQVMK